MSDVTSVAVGFRTLQAISDLRALARHAGDETLARITAGIFNDDARYELRRTIQGRGCRLSGQTAQEMHHALILAATLPNDDMQGFIASTAILLADRLQRGGGTDDLYWHWDAFNDHYRQLPDATRAAIMNGYRRTHDEGLVSLEDPPGGEDLCTDRFAETVALARSLDPSELRDMLISALTLGQTDDIAALWASQGQKLLTSSNRRVTAILRHILESVRDFDPYDDARFPVHLSLAPVLPFLPD